MLNIDSLHVNYFSISKELPPLSEEPGTVKERDYNHSPLTQLLLQTSLHLTDYTHRPLLLVIPWHSYDCKYISLTGSSRPYNFVIWHAFYNFYLEKYKLFQFVKMGPEDENSNSVLQLNLRANISDVTVHMPSTSHELEHCWRR